jgi:hypothetical protein
MFHITNRRRPGAAALASLVAIVTTTALSAAALANPGSPGVRVQLQQTQAVNCDTGGSPAPATESYFILSWNDRTVAAKVELRHAQPEATYDVYLAQTPLTADNPTCYPGLVIGTITTNPAGNGHGDFSAPRYSSTTGAFVSVLDVPHGGSDFQSSPNTTFS